MNRLRALAALAMAAMPLSTSANDDMPTAADAGHALLVANCSRCHAIGTDEVSPEPAAPTFRDVSHRYPPSDLAEALAEGILTGHPEMPEFVFEPNEIEGIVAYLEWLQLR